MTDAKIAANPLSLLDLSLFPDAFSHEECFSRPNWPLIRGLLKEKVAAEDLSYAWSEVAAQWMLRVAQDLGANYRVDASQKFLLVSALDTEKAAQLLNMAESILDEIELALAEAAWKSKYGKHIIILFAEDDDYYQYVSYYYPEGVHPTSGGCLLHVDYVHIAIPHEFDGGLRRILAHELTHNCLVHLRLPLWLNEGLAQWFEEGMSGSRNFRLEYDQLDRHFAFWNTSTIQKFWAGASFSEPGESNKLSYSLAKILVNLLVSDKANFAAFILHAQQIDGGQTAAIDFLGRDLGSLAGTFLGEGNWRPVRKAMVEAWTDYRKTHPESTDEKQPSS